MRSSTVGPTLLTDLVDGVRMLTLNRPDRRNAIDAELRDALAAAVHDAGARADVRGLVLTGAGLALALACDWRIGSPRARILFREGRVGLVPTHGGLTRLVKLVGLARAKEVLLGGDDLDARHAHDAGLLTEIAGDGEDVVALARARVNAMLVRAPLSFAAAKRLLHLAADVDQRSAMLAESLAQTALLQTEDHHEGLAAARERRDPRFRAI